MGVCMTDDMDAILPMGGYFPEIRMRNGSNTMNVIIFFISDIIFQR